MWKFVVILVLSAHYVVVHGDSASADGHWAFQPVKEFVPPVDTSGWAANPIDRFVAGKLRERGLTPVPQADRRTLARRLYYDLIGLPPAPTELRAFVEDTAPSAVEILADRLLASPRYGERWGRYWMDVVRYADTAGDNADYPIPEARLYRDYIIDSFNAEKPYDQFVREQLAGDILAKDSQSGDSTEQQIATSFIALSRRYGTGPGELWHLVLEDTIETTGRAFMGMTFRCARCHDHKYDPVTQEDYYAMYGMFASTRYPWAGSEEVESKKLTRLNFVSLLPEGVTKLRQKEYEKQIENLKFQIEELEKNDPLVASIAVLTNRLHGISNRVHVLRGEGFELPSLRTQLAALKKLTDDEKKKLREKLKPFRTELRGLEVPGIPPNVASAYAVREGKAMDACLQIRGDPKQPGVAVRRDVPKFLSNGKPLAIPGGSSGRLQFAEWLASAENPLAARVMVNRIWHHHFGRGIVGTPSNFGLGGEAPTHPELLDWLAAYFMRNNWSVKAVQRLIVQSKTYRLSSAEYAEARDMDPGNRFYWRHDRRRLDAESIRDSMLMVGGSLDLTNPGNHPFPSFQEWHWTQHNPFKTSYESSHRSVFLMTQRFKQHPYLGLFDGADANTSTDVRAVSTVPAQALFMMNNSFVQEQATALARRLLSVCEDDRQRVLLAGELVWSREIRGQECAKALEYINYVRREFEDLGELTENVELQAWTRYARILLMGNEFLYID